MLQISSLGIGVNQIKVSHSEEFGGSLESVIANLIFIISNNVRH